MMFSKLGWFRSKTRKISKKKRTIQCNLDLKEIGSIDAQVLQRHPEDFSCGVIQEPNLCEGIFLLRVAERKKAKRRFFLFTAIQCNFGPEKKSYPIDSEDLCLQPQNYTEARAFVITISCWDIYKKLNRCEEILLLSVAERERKERRIFPIQCNFGPEKKSDPMDAQGIQKDTLKIYVSNLQNYTEARTELVPTGTGRMNKTNFGKLIQNVQAFHYGPEGPAINQMQESGPKRKIFTVTGVFLYDKGKNQ
ncbi:hypothetical protein CEXT_327761 [Caerostris extrusa]|uniref:Uncharacterized protein n=1 Tax=Caerostris extrusa TaxID=172846 RepID=A0AAV4MGP5_CAEEX|nr:hypothetical protein CEXT_327761 [Caerostris extrusa]